MGSISKNKGDLLTSTVGSFGSTRDLLTLKSKVTNPVDLLTGAASINKGKQEHSRYFVRTLLVELNFGLVIKEGMIVGIKGMNDYLNE